MKRITIDLDEDLHYRLKVETAKARTPITELVRRLLKEWVEKQERRHPNS